MMSNSDTTTDEQWASLTRSTYTQNTDDAMLRVELCKAYGAECRKQHILSPTPDALHEAELWELAGRLPALAGVHDNNKSMTIEGLLQEPLSVRVMALKTWLEECQPAFNPTPTHLHTVDLDSHPQQTDATSLRCAEAVFKLLRKGRLEQAISYFKQSGAAWKAAIMCGGRYERAGEERQVWRQAVERLLAREVSWEGAWLGVLVGQSAPVVKVLRSTGQYTWRDAVWLNCVAVIDRACEQVLAGSPTTITIDQVFTGIDAPKDRHYYACKAVFLDSCQHTQPQLDDRFALHLALVIGGDVGMVDGLLSEWILSRQTMPYSIWYLSLVSTFEQAVHILSVVLVNAVEAAKGRRSILYAAGEAGLGGVVVKAADVAIGTLGCQNAVDLLTSTTVDSAIRRINEHARSIVTCHITDWQLAAAELGAFFATLPEHLLSPSTLDDLSEHDDALVAKVATFMHLCRLGHLHKDHQSIRRSSPQAHHTDLGEFGAARKFAERTEHAWRLRLTAAATAFAESAQELLREGSGAWWAESVLGDFFMQRLRASYAPALREAIRQIAPTGGPTGGAQLPIAGAQ